MANICIAEDNSSMLNFLKMALQRAGHNVTTSENGNEALDALRNNPDFDLLLTDIVMPGMDGIELSQKATYLYPTLKIMFITGFAALTLNQDTSPEHKTKILSKPFHLNDLVDQVETLLKAA